MPDHTFWKLGFRPFFFFGIIYALVLISYWVAIQTGFLTWPHPVNPITWHGHEMIFGFVTAIVAGFILTASQNWSGVRGVHGRPLMSLVGLWILGRVFAGFAPETYAFSIVDLLFYPALAWLLKPHLGIESQKRNRIFFVVFFLMFAANALFHFAKHFDSQFQNLALYFSIYLVITMVVLIAGRVVPFFTQRALNSLPVGVAPGLDRWLVPSVIAYAFVFILFPDSQLTGWFGLINAGLFVVRLILWKPWRSIRVPILFILYVGYAFIPIGFLVNSLSVFGGLRLSLGAHAFGFGVIGIFIYGMVSRVSLGHTGRPIRASRLTVMGYAMMTTGALVRVFGSLLVPEQWTATISLAGGLWVVSFALMAYQYLPILLAPRLDGAEG